MGYFKLTAHLDFEAEGAALPTLPPTILIIEGIRNGRQKATQSRVSSRRINSHAFPVFEEVLQTPQPQRSQRLNTAHKHPIPPFHPRQLAQGIKDDVQSQHGALGIWLQALVHIDGGGEQLAFRGHLRR